MLYNFEKLKMNMKNSIIIILTVLLFVLLFSTQESFGQINLNGKWSSTCAIERTSKTSIAYCPLCSSIISKDTKTFSINGFEMDISKATLKLQIGNDTTQVDYKLDEVLETLSFTFKGKDYKFKLLNIAGSSMSKYIMKDNDGMLILIEKI